MITSGKTKIIILSGLLIIFLCGFVLWKLNKDILLIWNSNNIDVKTGNSLTKDKVKIEFGNGVNTINRLNDTDLFKNRDKYFVLYDGRLREEMINDYGENDFLVTYNDTYYFSFRQFKSNRRHQHNYKFHFFEKADKIFLKVDIRGQDAMTFERPMIEISRAEQYRCNVPVDSAGIIYNMIELVNSE